MMMMINCNAHSFSCRCSLLLALLITPERHSEISKSVGRSIRPSIHPSIHQSLVVFGMAVFLGKPGESLRGDDHLVVVVVVVFVFVCILLLLLLRSLALVDGRQKDVKLRSVDVLVASALAFAGMESLDGSNEFGRDQSLHAGLVPECHRHVSPGPAGRDAGLDHPQEVHDGGRVALGQSVVVVGEVVVDAKAVGEALVDDHGAASRVVPCRQTEIANAPERRIVRHHGRCRGGKKEVVVVVVVLVVEVVRLPRSPGHAVQVVRFQQLQIRVRRLFRRWSGLERDLGSAGHGIQNGIVHGRCDTGCGKVGNATAHQSGVHVVVLVVVVISVAVAIAITITAVTIAAVTTTTTTAAAIRGTRSPGLVVESLLSELQIHFTLVVEAFHDVHHAFQRRRQFLRIDADSSTRAGTRSPVQRKGRNRGVVASQQVFHQLARFPRQRVGGVAILPRRW
mmetsp:Transcript_7147/g.17946  ORF Transcript_7147/g.17946 Transcript_7147/m.17946 type:complete len:452 (+) Transcript_7147:2-1357(+)